MLKVLSPLCIALLLASCGGDIGESTPTPIIQTQSGSTLKASFDTQGNMLTLEWQDVATNEIGYRVEKKIESVVAAVASSWAVVEDLPAYTGQGQKITWKKMITAEGEYRVLVKLPDQNKVLLTEDASSMASTQSVIVDPNLQASIVLSQQEPVHDSVVLSVNMVGITGVNVGDTTHYPSANLTSAEINPRRVTYYKDLFLIGTGTYDNYRSFSTTWNVATEVDGSYQILAKVEVAPNNYFLIRRQVQVRKPHLTVNIVSSREISAFAPAGIKRGQLFLDNKLAATFSPDTCGAETAIVESCYWHTQEFDGTQEVKVIVEDNLGETATAIQPIYKFPPAIQIMLDTPLAGQLVDQTLQISGSIKSDETDPLLVIYLRGFEIYRGVGKQFSTSFDMSSLPSGDYSLTLSVTPASGGTISKSIQINHQTH